MASAQQPQPPALSSIHPFILFHGISFIVLTFQQGNINSTFHACFQHFVQLINMILCYSNTQSSRPLITLPCRHSGMGMCQKLAQVRTKALTLLITGPSDLLCIVTGRPTGLRRPPTASAAGQQGQGDRSKRADTGRLARSLGLASRLPRCAGHAAASPVASSRARSSRLGSGGLVLTEV